MWVYISCYTLVHFSCSLLRAGKPLAVCDETGRQCVTGMDAESPRHRDMTSAIYLVASLSVRRNWTAGCDETGHRYSKTQTHALATKYISPILPPQGTSTIILSPNSKIVLQ
jgi:hypothetical protein